MNKMTKHLLLFSAVILGVALMLVTVYEAAASPLVSPETTASTAADLIVPVAFKCNLVGGKLVCGDKQDGSKKQSGNDDDDDKPKKSKDKVIPETCGKKVNCETGFVKLEKPNKYGACCEAREGLPPPTQAEPEKCKFPGQIGTPPNCQCPEDTEFRGYKGCLKYTEAKSCKKVVSFSVEDQIFARECHSEHSHGVDECHHTQDPVFLECCCRYRAYQP